MPHVQASLKKKRQQNYCEREQRIFSLLPGDVTCSSREILALIVIIKNSLF